MTLDEVIQKVTDMQGTEASMEELLTNLHQMLLDAIATNDPAKVQAVADMIDATKARMVAAVAANPIP